jgi:hypothetical protein
MVEPVQAKFPEFLGKFSCDELLVQTIGRSQAESGCFNRWAVVLVQCDRNKAFMGKESSALAKVQTAIRALHAAFGWYHPRERDPDTGLVSWTPRTIIYPMGIAGIVSNIRTGH